ncbi:hypothetical protein GCM10008018_38020 [Paenibacillus marchantiophytorum]|uniref:Prepilin-type N-terminal cleavage/methylation domain-containing protein n=1 Tax=Paenibacillus marchantiophytorum TaxID=1619310 RepID=A0ABQ1EVB2_9BACL|nr:type II secretion system protein [Paenibacillus marchantiophytorum]GFZ88275.1 hypothetical protein GCM10008018_38020 [Paenibacillus marchantiophytorum]
MILKMMNRLKKEEKGFTLIELLAVIVILAVIAAIAVPYILGVITKSKDDADAAFFHQVYEASRLYITSEKAGSAPATVKVLTDLVGGKYLEAGLVMPSTKDAITAGKLEYNTSTGAIINIVLTTSVDTYTITPVNDVVVGKGKKTAAATDYLSES